MKRTFGLALSIRDKKRIENVKNAIINLEDKIGIDDKPGLWGFSYDILIKKNIKILNDNEIQMIIQKIEERIERLSANIDKINPWAIEAGAIRLAEFYRKNNDLENIKRVLKMIEDSFEKLGKSSSALQRVTWFEKLEKIYTQFNLKKESDNIKKKINELGTEINNSMKPFSIPMNIGKVELEQFLNDMVNGNFEEVCKRIAFQYLPLKEESEKQVIDASKKHPLLYILSNKSIYDEKGRKIANIGSIDSDLEGNIIKNISEDITFKSFFLYKCIRKFIEKFDVNSDKIIEKLSKIPIFEKERLEIIKKGIDAYLINDFIASIHILIPQIENIIRILLETSGGNILKSIKIWRI